MSNMFGKATRKFKTKFGQAVDRLRSPPLESRAASPDPSQPSGQPTTRAPKGVAHQSASNAAAAIAQSSVAPISATSPPSQIAASSSAAADASPPFGPTAIAVPVYARPPSPPTILATTGSVVKGMLVAVRNGSDLFLPLKAALVGVLALWDIFDHTVKAKAEFKKLESRLVAFKAIADVHQDEHCVVDQNLQKRLISIAQAVQGLWEAVEQRRARGGLARMVQSSIDLGDIKTLVDTISSLLEVFQFESSIAVEKRLGLIIERLEADKSDRLIKEHVKKQEKIMKTIKSALGDNFVSEAADYEQPSHAGCMIGTRVGVLSKFAAWAKEDPMAIFWLAGMAGTGKTSIAVSLCRMLRQDPTVLFGGGYFCSLSAGSIARTDVRRIIPTMATLLADESKDFAELLVAELGKDRNLGHKPVAEQIGPLLRGPLDSLAMSTRSIVFLIDALDECSNERELAELLGILTDFKCATKVKFILTSRPELHIRGTPISNVDLNTVLQLHTISPEEVTSDIRLYIGGMLKDTSPERTWYTDQDTEQLVVLCGGLFIFASTALRYVLDPDDDEERRHRLQKVTSTAVKRTAATATIDKIYELVLAEASRSDTVDEDEVDSMKRILACILTARAPLSVEVLAALMEIKPGRLRASLRRLHSLVHLPAEDNQPGLRTLHASFGDFLHDRAPQHLRIIASFGHEILARGCIRRLGCDDLCFNVSRSRCSFEPNPDIAPDWIPDSLSYACLYWAHHIDAASDRSAFDVEIERIFRPKFMFWLEVISILGKIRLASGLLRIAGSAVSLPIVSQFLHDANAFVASSYTVISMSAPHIYTSALAFAAKDSLVYRDFASLCNGIITVTTFGISCHGNRLVSTLTGHDDVVNVVAYSPDGLSLASGSDDGTVRIWDTRTGEDSMTLRSNDGPVLCLAFAPDGKRIVSGGEGEVVHVWSTMTGRADLPRLRGHSNSVQSVAFSPDGALIASASNDNTVRLWSAETGLAICVMNGHTDEVRALAFSPDGLLLASASTDETVRLWNPRTGEEAGDPLSGVKDAVTNVHFSPNGRRLAAGSENTYEARIWDLETRESIPVVIKDPSGTECVVFSPDGLKLVSAGWRSIRTWDLKTGLELRGSSLSGHSDWVNSIAFSPDGLFLASGSDDSTVLIWDAVGSLEPASPPMHTYNDVVVSPDGTFIVSGSDDYSVQIWDNSTGEAKLKPLLGHENAVLAVAISSSGNMIASTSVDQTVRLWDAQSGDPVGEPLKGHEGEVNALGFSPDDRWLVSGSDDETVRVWDVAARQAAPFGPFNCNNIVFAVEFSPDGQLLAAADFGGAIHFWRSGTNRQARDVLRASVIGINTIAFSPDSRLIASGSDDKTISIWDIASGHEVSRLMGHFDSVNSIAYSSDGLHLVSASDDRTLRLWDATTGNAIFTLHGHGNEVHSVAFTPDGCTIVSCGADKTIHAWSVESALSLISQAEREDPLARLGSASLDTDGWLVGPAGELLLWLPPEYRGHIPLPPCSMLIGAHRVVLSFDDGLHWGDQWTSCWRNSTQPIA